MNNEENKEENKNQFEKVKEKLSKKPQLPKNPFNIYWFYGIALIILIGMNFFNFNGETKQITFADFEENILKKHHVERIVISNEEIAEIYIKRDSLKLPHYEKISKKPIGSGINPGPHYYLKIASIESFVANLNEAQKEFTSSEKLYPEKETRSNWMDQYGGMLLTLHGGLQ